MNHRIAVAAIASAALIIGACADQDGGAQRFSTEPGADAPMASSGVHYFTKSIATVRDPKSNKLVTIPLSASVTANGSVVVTTGPAEAMQIPLSAPGIAKSGGTSTFTFDDSTKHHHVFALLYAGSGGPPAAIQHYVDGSLVSTSAYTWQRTSSAWLRTHSLVQVVRNGTLYGTYTTTATAPKGGGPAPVPVRFDHAPAGPLQQLLGRVAYGLAFALAPQDANAQMTTILYACRQELLKYAAAAAVVIGITAVITELPALTPVISMQLAGSLALMAATEDAMLDCFIGHMSPFIGGGQGGGGHMQPPPAECLSGSFAPQCSAPLTL
jgi:hypothetical protein